MLGVQRGVVRCPGAQLTPLPGLTYVCVRPCRRAPVPSGVIDSGARGTLLVPGLPVGDLGPKFVVAFAVGGRVPALGFGVTCQVTCWESYKTHSRYRNGVCDFWNAVVELPRVFLAFSGQF